MKSRWVIPALLFALVLVAACTEEEKKQIDQATARLGEKTLLRFAAEHLSDDDVSAAVPEPFKASGLNRNGYDRHRKPWITVGVQMEGPVRFSRAVFYVHPSAAAAREMFQEQSGFSAVEDLDGDDPHAEAFSLDQLGVPNRCSPRLDRLFWCHSYKGSVYLLTQSSAGWFNRRDVTHKERDAAQTLLQAFGTFLEEQLP